MVTTAPHPNPATRPGSEISQPTLRFTDSLYLSRVAGFLRAERKRQKLSISQVARLAGVKRSLIDRAEQDGYIPCCRDFKAWSLALGIDWEELWTASCPSA